MQSPEKAVTEDTATVETAAVETAAVETVLPDTTARQQDDTTRRFDPSRFLMLADTTKEGRQEAHTQAFYQKLKEAFYRSRLTRMLFDLLFVKPATQKQTTAFDRQTVERYQPFQDRVIGNISIQKLQLFGPTVTDTSKAPHSWLQKTLNKLHISTQDRVIRKNLLIHSGEKIDPYELADSERVLRDLPFIRDARIHLIPRQEGSDTLDVLVLSQDVLPYSAGGTYRRLNNLSLILSNNNLLGLGHELRNEIIYDEIQTPSFGYRGLYNIPNIGGSFISSQLQYAETEYEKIKGLNLNRSFFTPNVYWAGGLELNSSTVKRALLFLDSSKDSLFHYRYNYTNLWGARAFRLHRKKEEISSKERDRLVVAARFSRTDYRMRPDLSPIPSDMHYFHNKLLYLGSIGWNRRRYFRDQYIFGFGRTEDVPYGSLINFTFGQENGEMTRQNFAGLKLASARYFPKFGYLYGQLDIASFFNSNRQSQRRLLHLESDYYSPLLKAGKYNFRQIITIDYTYGDRRLAHEFLHIRRENIRGLSTFERRGTQRLSIRLETICYTPLYLLGFQFAGFAFGDIAFLNQLNKLSLKGYDFHGYGLGVRVRNENLTFNTFQFRFTLYPHTPEKKFDLSISAIPSQLFNNFRIGEPQPYRFQ